MPFKVLVPPLSQTMDTLVLVEWLKQVGDSVVKGEALFTVETDKSTLEVEAPVSGILQAIYAQPNDEIKVRSVIGLILEPNEMPLPESQSIAPVRVAVSPLPATRQDWTFASPRARRLAQHANIPLSALPATGPRSMIVERDVQAYLTQQANNPDQTPKVTPVARRIAAEHALDLTALASQSTDTVIKRADVEAALELQAADIPAKVDAPTAAPSRVVKLTPLRKTIARRMQDSHLASAPVTLTRLLDATELKHLRARILKEIGASDSRPSYTDFLVKIVARCLLDHPELNATFDGETLTVFDDVHMGLAVDTERGLLVPVLRSVQGLGLLELTRQRGDLVRRAVEAQLTPAELSGGTFSLTNLGALGVDSFTPIINPPQIAVLGVGRIYSAPAAYQGQIVLREMLHLSLTFDHRVVDGAPAARFLQDIVRRIEQPDLIWL